MPAVGVELVAILFLILANGVLAMAEMALVSARKAHQVLQLVAGVLRLPYGGTTA